MRRRTLLLTAAGTAGALVVGWSFAPQRSRLGSGSLMPTGDGDIALNGWIKITPDNRVVLAMPRSEMGQGVHTALPMLAAEELDVPLASMRIEQASADSIYGNVATILDFLPLHPRDIEGEDGFAHTKAQLARWAVGKLAREIGINATGGSTSVVDAWYVVRTAAATARASLLGAASLQWRLPVEELSVLDGVISHPSGKSASFGEMAKWASATPPSSVRLKEPKAWKLIGTPAPRLDVPSKVDGSARFGIDVRLPHMRFAVLRLCPMLGGSPGAVNADKALAMAGVERLVMLPAYAGSTAGFAVVGRSYWHAQRAVRAVEVEWRPPPGDALDSGRIAAKLKSAVHREDGFVFHASGDVSGAERRSSTHIEAWYSAPYLAHATMEPMNCTARVSDGTVELWVPTQVPQMCAAVAARVAGVPLKNVIIHVTLLGGGFGRRLEVDYAAFAVRVAMDCPGVAVQLVWPREEDMTHDFYRPMHVAMLRASLDAQGEVTSVRIKSAGDSISPRWLERGLPALAGPFDAPDKKSAEGLFDQAYGFPHQRVEHVATRMGVPVGYWRSVGHSHNAFIIESFVDELAAQKAEDPVEFRRHWLQGAPRHLAVLDLVASKSGWGTKLPPGRARGVALHESFGTIVAEVAEVSIGSDGLRVHRVVCAVDCGAVVNPNVVAQQIEGSVVYGLTATLYGATDISGSIVRQTSFQDYPMIKMETAPVVETWLISSDRPPGGIGEPGVPPLAPAIANALYALNGRRSRSLPLHVELK